MVEQEDGVVERKQWSMQEGKWRRERELWFLVPPLQVGVASPYKYAHKIGLELSTMEESMTKME